MKAFTKKIVLEDGREFYGYGFGSDREAINEIVFNTSMVGPRWWGIRRSCPIRRTRIRWW